MRLSTLALLVAAALVAGCSEFGALDLQGPPLARAPHSRAPMSLPGSSPLHLNPRLRGANHLPTAAATSSNTSCPTLPERPFERVTYFTSNGAGLAVGDLDNDGDEDFVLANLLGPNQIFWNEGGWQFRPQLLLDGSLRGLALVDVDGDGWLDITATSRSGILLYWRNNGGQDSAAPFASEQERRAPAGGQRLRLLAAVGRSGQGRRPRSGDRHL